MSQPLTVAIRRFNAAGFLRTRVQNLHEGPEELNMDCPFCHGSQKMYVNKLTKAWICHKCGERGDLIDLVSAISGLDMPDAIKLIVDSKHHGMVLQAGRRETINEAVEIKLPPGFKKLSFPENKENQRYWDYLLGTKRNLPASTVLEYGLGYCPRGRYAQRVVVPVYWFGTLVNWVARSLSDKATRTKLTPPGNRQSHYLFNLDKLWGREEVVLVEGPFDMLKIPDIAVASFGKVLRKPQLALLTKAGVKRIIVAYDDDALAETWKTAKLLSERFDVRIATLPPNEDPGSLPEAVTRKYIRDAKPYSYADYLRFKAGTS